MAPPSDEEKAKLWENARKQVQGEEDSPIVVALKKVDDQYLELQKAYEKEAKLLCREFTVKQKPLLEERAKKLEGDSSAVEWGKTGTPAIKGFWCEALKNHPAFEDIVEEYDEPVLEYIKDITKVDLDPDDEDKGFRLRFHFVENPYFKNSVLSKEYHTDPVDPYTGDTDVAEIRGCEIDWKPGKDVTFEMVKKKVTGGGAKKAKQAGKETKEMRPSFFRVFFLNLKKGGRLPENIDVEELAMQAGMDGGDEDDLLEVLMDGDHERGSALRDNVIPFAVRWYTGEAAPERDDDDDDEDDDDDDEDDEDDEDDDDDSEDEPPPVKGKKGKAPPAKDKKEDAAEGDGKKKEEECKQQ